MKSGVRKKIDVISLWTCRHFKAKSTIAIREYLTQKTRQPELDITHTSEIVEFSFLLDAVSVPVLWLSAHAMCRQEGHIFPLAKLCKD